MSALNLTPPKTQTLVDLIVMELLKQVREGSLKPGEQLPSQRELAEILRVGRSSVREALQALSAMNVVEIRPGQGTFVKESASLEAASAKDIVTLSVLLEEEMREELAEARMILEGEIAALAATDPIPGSEESIIDALDEYEALSLDRGTEEWWEAHDSVHLCIAAATGNRILGRVVKNLLELVPKSLRDRISAETSPEDLKNQIEFEEKCHRALCEAVIQGEPVLARKWMERHANHERSVLQEYYERTKTARRDGPEENAQIVL